MNLKSGTLIEVRDKITFNKVSGLFIFLEYEKMGSPICNFYKVYCIQEREIRYIRTDCFAIRVLS